MAVLVIRKAWRLCGIIFPLVYYFSNKIITIFLVLAFLCIFLVIEALRFFVTGFNERLFGIFRYILKEKEKKGLLTTTWFLLSVFFTVIFFKDNIAITAMLFLIFGDAMSGIVGTYFGRVRIGNRSLEGSLAFFVICLIIGISLRFTKVNLSWPILISGALTATITELSALPLDDNFTVALFSGIIMTFMSKIII